MRHNSGYRRSIGRAANLLKMADRVDSKINGAPTFLAVVTASGSSYKRQDGVLVLPIGVLGP